MRQGVRMGVHYCSLENKLTGQVYQQNKFVPLLAHDAPNMPVAICFAIAEQRAGEPVLRELMLQRTTPASFDYDTDL